jgi:undecaprenyl-diphosphatase
VYWGYSTVDVLRAIILGVVQGLAEPLPISSSGHLILVPWLLGWPEHSLTFDVALHGGTALAIIVYFWRDWIALIGGFFAGLRDRDFKSSYYRRLSIYIIVSSVPGAVSGVLFEQKIESLLRTPLLVATLLIVMGLVMMAVDRYASRTRSLGDLTIWDAIIIGLAPGVSRSGVTITTALILQMNRADAARFSFLMSGPIVTGAFLYKMYGVAKEGFPVDERAPFLVGIAVAAVVGYVAIRFLLGYLQKRSLKLFVGYRLAFGALVIGTIVLRGGA